MDDQEGPSKVKQLLRALMPQCIADALADHEDDISFIASQSLLYLEGDADTRADILSFHEFDGPKQIHQAQEKIENGTPTAADLQEWINEEEGS